MEAPIVKKHWTRSLETLLASWADIASCYVWLHNHAQRQFRKRHFLFSIPAIILSTLTGTANFGIGSFVPAGQMQRAQVALGLVNIVTGILGTLQSFFRFAENSESHFMAAQGWSKLNRDVADELRLERSQRKDADDFFKRVKNEYDRLIESSPIIPMESIRSFLSSVDVTTSVMRPPETRMAITSTFIYQDDDLEKQPTSLNMTPIMSTKDYVQSVVQHVVSRSTTRDNSDDETTRAGQGPVETGHDGPLDTQASH